MSWQVIEADCVEAMREMDDASIDAVVTDPPAGISFMNRSWDSDRSGGFVAWLASVMEEALRVTKPGGHALVWALPRTSHWTGSAIEAAGWEIRDRISHHFGSGFPKSLNLGNGLGTALKPATEDWWLARKPLIGTVAQNVERFGTGAINVDACRIGAEGGTRKGTFPNEPSVSAYGDGLNGACEIEPTGSGRWPANVALSCKCPDDSHSEPSCAVAELDRQSGERPGASSNSDHGTGYWKNADRGIPLQEGYGDIGGAARFFYQAKASRAERDSGLGIDRCTCETSSEWVNEDQPANTPPDSGPLPLRVITAPTSEDGSEWSTTGSGSSTTDQSQLADLSTTETDASRTTESRTSSLSIPSPTSDSTLPTTDSETDDGSAAAPSAESGRSRTPRTSTSRGRAGSATADADPVTSEPSLNRNSEGARCASCGGVIGGALRNAHPT